MSSQPNYATAISDFRRARSQAVLKEIIARFTGESTQLLSYEEVRRKLKAQEGPARGLQDIPLDAIVGSVGRYFDFTRDFLPRQATDEGRWARVKVAVSDLTGLPPIEVYQIGDVYFVKDGNHRVSVARQLGATHIQAYVTAVRTRVPISADINPDQLILKAEYVEFLEHTQLDKLRPGADLSVTEPGNYPILDEHISVHRYYMGIEQNREISYAEAVQHWYDNVYIPVIELIRERGILHHFPGRSETDLYLWIAKHREQIENQLGWEIKTEYALEDLNEHIRSSKKSIFSKIGDIVLEALPFDMLDSGPEVGKWRKQTVESRQSDRLFLDILVPITGAPDSWQALDQSIEIARREGARLNGLHIVPSGSDTENPDLLPLRDEFENRCSQAGVVGKLAISAGEINEQICARSRFSDLIVVKLSHPPGDLPIQRLDSGIRDIIQRCPRPIMTVPGDISKFERAMLAYDGSPKSQEALFIATYLSGSWGVPLTIVTVFENEQVPPETLLKAKSYIEEHGLDAETIPVKGFVTESILTQVKEKSADLLIMGGYGLNPLVEVVLGSVVDQVLRESKVPTLICR